MIKKLFCTVLVCFWFSLYATTSFESNFFTLNNNGTDFSYGLDGSMSLEYQKDSFSTSAFCSMLTYKNLYIPFKSFTLTSSYINTFNYYLDIGYKCQPVSLKASLFGTQLLDNQFSASIFNFPVDLKKELGMDFSISLFDSLTFSTGFFKCSPEITSGANTANGDFRFIFETADYTLNYDKADFIFLAGYLYGTGNYEFNIPAYPGILFNLKYHGNGKAKLSAIATGASFSTKERPVNLSGWIGLIYIPEAIINTEVNKTTRILVFSSTDKSELEKDYSQTLIIPFNIQASFSVPISNVYLLTTLSKTVAIPVSLNKKNDYKTDTSNTSKFWRTILLSGLNVSVKLEIK